MEKEQIMAILQHELAEAEALLERMQAEYDSGSENVDGCDLERQQGVIDGLEIAGFTLMEATKNRDWKLT